MTDFRTSDPVLTIVRSGYCYDCMQSAAHPMLIPANWDLDDYKRAWRKWYDDIYCVGIQGKGLKVDYMSFIDYLRACGAQDADLPEWEEE